MDEPRLDTATEAERIRQNITEINKQIIRCWGQIRYFIKTKYEPGQHHWQKQLFFCRRWLQQEQRRLDARETRRLL